MIAIVELHATTPGHGLRKPQFNSNANLQSERPVFHSSVNKTSPPAASTPAATMAPTACRGRGNTRCGYPFCGSAGNTKELERFYEEAIKSLSSRFNEFLVRAQRLVACRSIATRQRSCPGSLQQIRQCCDHENHIGARSHPELWAASCGAAERAPCCERGGEDRILAIWIPKSETAVMFVP